MNKMFDATHGDTELMAFERAMEAIVPSSKQHKEASCMAKSYLVIEQTLVRNVPLKVVLETFNATYGLKTHPARFRKMLQQERARRKEAGDVVACKHCGHALTVDHKAEGASGANRDAEVVA